MTGNEKYLQPLRSMAALRLKWLKDRPEATPEVGSVLWAASKMKFLAGTLAKYRLLTGSDEFDDILARDYQALDVSESDTERTSLTESLRQSAEAMRVNFEGFTSEVRFTDRVFAFPRMFREDMMFAERKPQNCESPSPSLVYATATGDRGQFGIFPLNAVRWLTPPRNIAALVTRSGRDGLTAELFQFGPDARPMAAEFYLLKPGQYTMELRLAEGNELVTSTNFTVAGPRASVPFELPPRKLCKLHIK
jgi:hypothetical protein